MLKKLLKTILVNAPGFRALCRQLTKRHVRVFMYHRFSNSGSANDSCTLADTLQDQLQYVSQHHDTLSCDQHLASLRSNVPGGYCPVVFTIDDGYSDAKYIAAPLFQKYEVPVTIFLATNFISGAIWFWWDKLRYLLSAVRPLPHTFTLLDQEDRQIIITLPHSCDLAWDIISDVLVEQSPNRIEKNLCLISEQLDIELPTLAPKEYDALTWNDVNSLESDFIQFGSHTVNHPRLTKIDRKLAEIEIRESLRACSILARPSQVFCYPFGRVSDYSEEHFEILERYSVSGAYTSHEGSDTRQPYAQPRYASSNDHVEFHWKLCGAAYIFRFLKAAQ